MFRKLALVLGAILLMPQKASANDQILDGTYRLISATRTIVETGQTEDSFGKDPIGFITYGKDHRMSVLIVRRGRAKPTFQGLTESVRAGLFDTVAAYGGTYTFDGTNMVHHIDVSYNEILTGTDQRRMVKAVGNRLIYTTTPLPTPTDGKIATGELIWEKIDPGSPQLK
jgi:hypothetical protein